MPQKTENLWFKWIQLAVSAVILILVYQSWLKPLFKVEPEKSTHTETIIQGKTLQYHTIEKQVADTELVAKAVREATLPLYAELSRVKALKDTVRIIQVQDTLISGLTEENRLLVSTNKGKDSMLNIQKYISESKDTLLSLKDVEIKKIKKQRNISIIANIILGGIAIIK